MPNHIDNRLTIAGPPEDVSAFVAQARAATPAPGLSRNPLAAKVEAAIRDERPVIPLSFHAIVPLPKAYETEPYDPFGCAAERAAWGVKWGAYGIAEPELSEGRATYKFQTAWGPPGVWLARASEAWPTLDFLLSYGGEGPARGRIRFRGGESLHDQHDDYRAEDYPSESDYGEDDDAYFDAYKAAEHVYLQSHDEWVAEVTPF